MNRTFAMTLAVAAALVTYGCGKADAPTAPVAALNAPSAMAPDSSMTPPRTPAPEVALPPLPSNVTAATDKARDTPENQPKQESTPSEESNSMPKALHGNNHSSTALDTESSAK